MPDGKRPVVSTAQSIVNAQQAPLLANGPDDKLKEALRYIMVVLGLSASDVPDEVEKAVLMEVLTEQYGTRLTTEDLKMAVKMGVAGTIVSDDGKPIDTSLYGKRFSVAYLQRFIGPYENYKREIMKAEKRRLDAVSENRALDEPKELVQNRALAFWTETVLREGKMPMAFSVTECFHALLRSMSFNPTPEVIVDVFKEREKAIGDLERDARSRYGKESFALRDRLKLIRSQETAELEYQRAYVHAYWRQLLEQRKQDELPG